MVDKEEDKNKKEMWSMGDLISLTNEIQTAEVTFRGKVLNFQYCELTEKEEPVLNMTQDWKSDDEKNAYYMDVGVNRVKAMITKANDKNPEGITLTSENWADLPSTLRFQVANEIMGIEQDVSENFTIG